ncbi:MAG: GTP 3',8-cyclase MoaA [Bacteroidota bacterium]
MLIDNHGRPLNYLRLAVTDRCNLRCFYCMPEEGIEYLPKRSLLTFEEMERLVRLLAGMGITKVRVTGGEPFLRKDLMQLLHRIVSTEGIQELHLTTNGLLLGPHVKALAELGIRSVNLSLDTLDAARFKQITRRDEFSKVMSAMEQLRAAGIPMKINTVVMEGMNTEDIIPLARLTQTEPIQVRFIEEMPFNGTGNRHVSLAWDHKRILDHLQAHFPGLERGQEVANGTARHYRIPGAVGEIGIIAALTRTFCGTCNRIRVTAQGMLKTCLYDSGVLNIRDLMREGNDDESLKINLLSSFKNRHKDGFAAEAARPASASMATIGG